MCFIANLLLIDLIVLSNFYHNDDSSNFPTVIVYRHLLSSNFSGNSLLRNCQRNLLKKSLDAHIAYVL